MKLAEDSKLYVALLADMVRSRDLGTRRAAVQEAVLAQVARLNREHADLLRVPLALSGGDEVQGLLRRPSGAVPLMEALDLTRPEGVTWRFGLGAGDVTTAFRPTTFQMDGGCFLAARRALERARREKRRAAASGFPEPGDRVLDGVLAGIAAIRERWTDRQRQAAVVRRRHDTLTAAATALGVTPPTLSKMLKAARLRDLDELQGALAVLLDLFAAGGSAAGEEGRP